MTLENRRCITAFNETPRQGCAIARACAHHNGDRLLILHAAASLSKPATKLGLLSVRSLQTHLPTFWRVERGQRRLRPPCVSLPLTTASEKTAKQYHTANGLIGPAITVSKFPLALFLRDHEEVGFPPAPRSHAATNVSSVAGSPDFCLIRDGGSRSHAKISLKKSCMAIQDR